jgi:hypothetical protein
MPNTGETHAKATALPDLLAEMQTRTLDALTVFAQANQRVMQELVEFSTAAAKEGIRAYAELQSTALETARDAQAAVASQPDRTEELKDPFTWYQKSLLSAVDGTQKAFKLVEANAQILTRSAERIQASAQRTGKEIQEALTTYMTRMKDLSARN